MALATAQEGPALSPEPHLSHHGGGWHPNAAYERLATLAERLARTIAVARGLITAERRVDLAGFEDGVGLLCAKALDLDLGEARRLVPALLELRAQIDGLSGTIAGQRPQPGQPGSGRHKPSHRAAH